MTERATGQRLPRAARPHRGTGAADGGAAGTGAGTPDASPTGTRNPVAPDSNVPGGDVPGSGMPDISAPGGDAPAGGVPGGGHTAPVTRHHTDGATTSSAVYSPCDRYRYLLTRTWDAGLPRLLFVMLNPSKATEAHNDPTIERCERRARGLGFGAVRIANIFAWRDTDPRALKRAAEPVGPHNAALLMRSVTDWISPPGDLILCAWGTHGAHRGQGALTEALLRRAGRPLHSLGLTKDGHPAHPLYVPYARLPRLWDPYPDAPLT